MTLLNIKTFAGLIFRKQLFTFTKMEDRLLRKDTSFANEKFPTSIAENMTRDKIS